jgi:hypothetical protein
MIMIYSISPFQGLGFVASPLHPAIRDVSVYRPFRALHCSPERAEYNSEAVTPLDTNDGRSPSGKNKNKKSPERA